MASDQRSRDDRVKSSFLLTGKTLRGMFTGGALVGGLAALRSREPALAAKRAVVVGYLVVNLPMLPIVALACFAAYVFLGRAKVALGLPIGLGLAWLWWSAMVPRWREWARNQGADADQTQELAEMTGLV
jgi:hypothetical protein